jgi:hypothetical protein
MSQRASTPVQPREPHPFVAFEYVGFMRVESGLCHARVADPDGGFSGCNLPLGHPFHRVVA